MNMLKSMRIKKRYISFEVASSVNLKKGDVIKAVLQSTVRFLGENTASELNLWVIEYDEEKKHGILVCNRENLGEVIASLALINRMNEANAAIRTLKVSGTVKGLRSKK